MPHLTLVGMDGGTRLLLVDDAGTEHTLDIDARLRAAVRGTTPRPGQLEMTMDSTLRPRDIQARIRAGETPEAVATAAQTTVEKIVVFAGPVLAERQHVAQRAQQSSVRRRAGDPAAAGVRTLGDAVAAHLRGRNIDPDVVEWDSWRREDGRWTLTATYRTADRTEGTGAGREGRDGVASFTYDVPGSYVTLDDDDARWLVGEQVAAPRAAAPSRPDSADVLTEAPSDDLSAARARRRGWSGASEEEELPLGEDAIEMISSTPVPAADPAAAVGPLEADPSAAGPDEGDATAAHQDTDQDTDRHTDRDTDRGEARDGSQDDASQQPDPDQAPVEEPPRRAVTKKRGRASVPSWDEIMFGGSDQ